jgi:hypothetical protein
MTGEKEIVVYNHIPKTAGTMMSDILQRHYKNVYKHHEPYHASFDKYHRKKFQSFLQGVADDTSCAISGHIYYDYTVIKSWNCKKVSFFTMLREPIRRLLSHYYFLYYNSINMWSYSQKKHLVPAFKEWCSQGQDNYMIRYILSKYEGQITLQDYYEAEKRLGCDYTVVGITELFNESLYLIYKQLQWKKFPYYPRKSNVTGMPDHIVKPSQDDIEYVTELNQYDFRVYSTFRKRFEETLASLEREELNYYLNNQKRITAGKLKIALADMLDDMINRMNEKSQEIGIFIFGTGEGGKQISNLLQEVSYHNNTRINVKGFFDNAVSKQGNKIGEVRVLTPQKECIGDPDYVVIASLSYYKEMREQVLAMGVKENKIIIPLTLLEEQLLSKVPKQRKPNENRVLITADETQQALTFKYECRLISHIEKFKDRSRPLQVFVYADGKQKEFILQALRNIAEYNPDQCISVSDRDEYDLDVYVVGIKQEWEKFADNLLVNGVDVDKLLFLI